jgi:ABC-type transporter Mla MlaB component
MPYKLSMGDDGILRMAFIGDIDEEDVLAYVEEYTPLSEAATEAGPLRILVDASQVGKVSSSARKALVEVYRAPGMGMLTTAVVGANRYVRVLAGFIMKALGRKGLRFFDSEEEALAWLKKEEV